MIVLEYKVRVNKIQAEAIDEAIRIGQFIQNKCLRLWMEQPGLTRYDLNGYCKVLAEEYPFAKALNSMARQASAERTWCAISRFYRNCRQNKPGKKGYPKFKKFCRSVEYKTCGWKLLGLKRIKFTDHNGIGELRLVGTYDLAHYHPSQIKRVRLVRRADGYYCQFCIKADGTVESEPTGRAIGLDLGIRYFLADSNGHTEESPHFYRRSEQQLNRYNRQKSKKYRQGVKPQSRNYHKARGRYARKHLRVSRQRKEYVKKLAYCVIQSNDLVAYENLNVSTPG
jgi:putative transposase